MLRTGCRTLKLAAVRGLAHEEQRCREPAGAVDDLRDGDGFEKREPEEERTGECEDRRAADGVHATVDRRGLAPAIMRSDAVVWRRSWKRIGRRLAYV
jgi:hypothetical protein